MPHALNAEDEITPARLEQIVDIDAKVRIYTDKFGGHYVLQQDGRTHGQLAMIHRRQLLGYVNMLRHELIQLQRERARYFGVTS